MSRIHNFSAGPAILPEEVLKKVQAELLDFDGNGMSIMEMSHRSKQFEALIAKTEADLRELLNIPVNYEVLFLQGGASHQFTMVPMNIYQDGKPADVIMTGAWTQKADKEIKKLGKTRIVATSEAENFNHIPEINEADFNPDASFVMTTSNNTIFGTQFKSFPNTGNVPLVCDMSSDILSRPIDVNQFGIIYAGAQKNIGPSGITIVIIRKDLAERAAETLPTIFQYRTHIKNKSLYNTIPTFPVYVVGLVLEWLKELGGLSAIQTINERKAKKLYDAIEASSFYYCPVKADSRSLMNVVFRVTGDVEELEAKFVKEAEQVGISGIKGHRSVGGLRASIYNAMPEKSIDALIEFMNSFEAKYAGQLQTQVAS